MPRNFLEFGAEFCCDCAWQSLRYLQDNRESELIWCRYINDEIWANCYPCPKFVRMIPPAHYKEP